MYNKSGTRLNVSDIQASMVGTTPNGAGTTTLSRKSRHQAMYDLIISKAIRGGNNEHTSSGLIGKRAT